MLECLSIPTGNRSCQTLAVPPCCTIVDVGERLRGPISLQGKCVEKERRRTPRYPFVATAEVFDTLSGAKISARVSELSLYGCYIDMINPPPEGTSIRVKIHSQGRRLDASGKVLYSAPNLGFGVSFHDVSVHSLIVLKEWLLLAAKAKYQHSK